ncbi:MAG: M23 family metallopeptidase [Ruminococcus sp.]|nr:M23 family metallopeptidase [Candidatus Apopatosoma intestinale]
MNVNQRKRQLNKGLTVVLALLLVTTVCITVVAFSVGRRHRDDPPAGSSSSSSTSSTRSTSGSTSQTASTSSTETTASTAKTDTPVVIPVPEFLCPVNAGVLASSYSGDIPVFSMTMEDYRTHTGIDIRADAGTPVYAAAAGTVSEIGFDPMMGQTVVIEHTGGYKSIYRNLQTAMPEGIVIGKTVAAGERIGSVGDTALVEISDSPHLHFEIRKNDVPEDPLSYISTTALSDNTFED